MAQKLFLLLQFIPLTIFLSIVRFSEKESPDWELAFIAGGYTAVIETIILSVRKKVLNRFILSVNLFLITGAVGFLLNIEMILNMYAFFMQSMLFICLVVVGLSTTFFSVNGFIGIQHHDSQLIRKYSLYLLCGTISALTFSLFFREQMVYAGLIPFLALLLLDKILSIRLLPSKKPVDQVN